MNSLFIWIFLAFVCQGTPYFEDELIQTIFYDYDLDVLNSIVLFSNDSITIKKNEYLYPVQYGKMWPYMRVHGWEEKRVLAQQAKLVYEDAFDSQYLTFRITSNFPNEEKDRTSYFADDSVIKAYYKRGANPFALFHEGTSEDADLNKNTKTGLTHVRVIPQAARLPMLKRMIDVYSVLGQISSDPSTLLQLSSNLLQVYDWFASSGEVEFDPSEPFDNVQDLPYLRKPFERVEVRPGEVLYAVSDECFHFFLDENGQDAFLVDSGSMLLANGLQQLVSNAQGIQRLYLFPTHFHIDHIASMASLINRTENIEITLVISNALSLQFTGWLLSNYAHLSSKICSSQLKFIFSDGARWLSLGSYEVLLVNTHSFADDRIKHTMDNASPVFRDRHGNFQMFAGDLQSPYYFFQPKEEFFAMMKSCYHQFFEVAGVQGGSHVDFYWGVGLLFWEMRLYPYEFDEEYDYYATVQEFYREMYGEFDGEVVLDIRPIHWVTTGFFNMVKHQAFSREVQL